MSAKRTDSQGKSQHTVDLLEHKSRLKHRGSGHSHSTITAEALFDQALAEYYAAKGAESNPNSFDALLDDTLRTEILAQKILSMPAITQGQVLKKLSIIDAELLADLDCGATVERRNIVAFAALKVDIVRLLASLSD